MEKLKELKQQVIDFINENRKIVIGISVGVIVFTLILFNIGFIQISYYKMTGDTKNIVNVISKDVKNIENQQKIYFKSGLEYLLQDMSDTSKAFLEKYFSYLEPITKEKVLKAYNTGDVLFSSQKIILDTIATGNTSLEIKNYINRLDENTLELALIDYFGKDPKLTQDIVTKLYAIASTYNAKLPMNKFTISIYELMKFPQIATADSVASNLLNVMDTKVIHKLLFTELKTQEIDVDELNIWVDILNKKSIISTQEYAGFTNSYSSIMQLRDEYTQLERQQVDMKNIKEKIDVQTSEYISNVDKVNKEIEVVQNDIGSKKAELSSVNNYTSIELYVMDYYGDGVYEASIPEKSWFFGTYKPSNQKVKIKLTSTKPDSQGVFTFNVYPQGKDSNKIPYYIEVSSEDKAKINALKEEIAQKQTTMEQKQNEKVKLQSEINKIRKANNYDQNNRLLEDVESKKENVILKIKEKQLDIQTLFGIGHVTISEDKK